MNSTNKPEMLPTRTQSLLRLTQRILFAAGTFALAYVGFTLLEAGLYQVSAKVSLENQIQQETQIQVEQIQTGKERTQPHPKPSVRKGDVLGRLDIARLGL